METTNQSKPSNKLGLTILFILVFSLLYVVDDLHKDKIDLEERIITLTQQKEEAEKVIRTSTGDRWDDFIKALAYEESRWDANAVGSKDDVGLLQVTPIVVAEVNRILGYEAYTLEDRYDPNKNIEMFCIIQDYKNPDHDIHLAMKIWNPRADLGYHNRVVANLYNILSGESLEGPKISDASISQIIADTLRYNWQMEFYSEL